MDSTPRTTDASTSVSARFQPLVSGTLAHVAWPWLLLSLVPVAVVIVADLLGGTFLYSKPLHERIAIPILVLAATAWLGRAARVRSAFLGLVGLQAVAFLLREIHFRGTDKGVYVATAIIGLVALRLAWRTDWRDAAKRVDWGTVTALAVTFAAYAVALLIQRRAFRMVPGEERLHVAFEEVCETWAHLCLLAGAFVHGKAKTDRS